MIRVALVIVLAFSAVAQAQPPGQSDRFIVTFRPGTSQTQRAASVQRARGVVRFNYSIVDSVAIHGANPSVLAALRNDPSVVRIVPDREIQAIEGPNDLVANGKSGSGGGGGSSQVTPQGVIRVGVPTASSNGEGVGVAILDTGIDLANADLSVSSTTFSSFGASC